MSTIVRPIISEDEPKWRQYWAAYNDFYKRTISEEVTATTFSRFLDTNVQMFCSVAVDETSDFVIGFVTWFPHMWTSHLNSVVYLNDLFVDPEIRSKGVGGKLIDHVCEHSKHTLGAETVYWLTQHFNHKAQLLYVKKATKSDFVHYSKDL
ncbi:acyl-CoA N-acyltransferase [Xylariaceae sp. FL0255]|nr:acyl-CoA N-acyltransferase [Xylariaceae sp. FL0255]